MVSKNFPSLSSTEIFLWTSNRKIKSVTIKSKRVNLCDYSFKHVSELVAWLIESTYVENMAADTTFLHSISIL